MKTCLNPESLPRNPAFSQVIVVEAPAATIYVGGQNAISPAGEIVGETLYDQARQALHNVEAGLAAAGASIGDVVRWTIAIVDGYPIAEGFKAFADAYGLMADPPTIGVHVVAGLANPRFLVEIDAVAVR
jgi:enamine deaminase RidA (YjgF/YER057c/UK114 family)